MTPAAKRPAAFLGAARGRGVPEPAGPYRAVREAARAHGWPEPAVYVDMAKLTAAISTGQHDALLVDVGTVCRHPAELMPLLAGCARHGVAVECVTPAGDAAARALR